MHAAELNGAGRSQMWCVVAWSLWFPVLVDCAFHFSANKSYTIGFFYRTHPSSGHSHHYRLGKWEGTTIQLQTLRFGLYGVLVKMLLYSVWGWCCTSAGWIHANPFHLARLLPKPVQGDPLHPASRPQVDPTQHHGTCHQSPRHRSPTGKDPSYLPGPTQATVSTTNTL